MPHKHLLSSLLLFFYLLNAGNLAGQAAQESIEHFSAAEDYIGVYQEFISGIRGHECPMYPSCSNFGIKTFRETGFLNAFALTADRLLRCGHDHRYYPLTLRSNGFKYLDFPAQSNIPKELYYSKNKYYFAVSNLVRNDTTLRFVKHLINQGYYREALLEINRLEYLETGFHKERFLNKLICFRALQEEEKALFEFETKCPLSYKEDAEILLVITLVHYNLGNLELAAGLASKAAALSDDEGLRSQLFSIVALSAARQGNWAPSKLAFEQVQQLNKHTNFAQSGIRLAETGAALKKKRPFVAGLMSAVIPGAGYAYTGHKQTALSALFVNGLLFYGTYSSIKNKNYGMGALTGVFNLSFYLGNIYGSAKSARRFNQESQLSIIRKMEFQTPFVNF